MKKDVLEVTIQKNPQFFSLYADGQEDTIIKNHSSSILLYPPDAVIFLYYTFPTHRRVYCVRNTNKEHMCELPGLSHSIAVLFKQFASRVDKTKKAVSYLREHYPHSAFSFDDGFYLRLDILLQLKGKLDYSELEALCKRNLKNGCIINT
jgi:hypothetical protein